MELTTIENVIDALKGPLKNYSIKTDTIKENDCEHNVLIIDNNLGFNLTYLLYSKEKYIVIKEMDFE